MDRTKIQRFGTGRHQIVYESYGKAVAGRSAIVLVHGLSGSSAWWRHNLEPLSTDQQVFTVDLIGYGRNRARRPASIADAADALAEFIAVVLPTGCAHVVGHSMGGHIAATLAARRPERVDRLVLAAASGLVRSHVAAMALRLPIAAHYSPLDFFPTLAWDALRAGPLNLLASTRHILGTDLTAELPRIRAKTLLIWGTKDNLVPETTGVKMAELIPDARFERIEGAGHVLMWDHAALFNRLVLEFIDT